MDTGHRYNLEKGSRKHRCPNCGKKTFVRFIDTQTGEYLPEQYGRCDREIKCCYLNSPPPPEQQEIKCLFVPFCKMEDYSLKACKIECENKKHFIPKSMIYEVGEKGCYVSEWYLQNTNKPPLFINNDCRYYPKAQRAEPPKPLPKRCNTIQNATPNPVFIPKDVLRQTLHGYEQNVFLQNLLSRIPFPIDKTGVERVAALYYLGTIVEGYRAGAITFPFIDKAGNVRAIQVKQFDETNHTTGTDFLHSIIEKQHQRKGEPLPDWLQAYNLNSLKVSCLFGEHLLPNYALNPVALVEAPKNAIYGTLYFGFPQQPENLLWLAVYNLSSLTLEKCKALQGRDVYLFPDLSKGGKAFQLWSSKAKEFTELLPRTRFFVSDLLESLAPAELRGKGADIADVLTGLDWKQIRELWQEANGKATQPEHEKYEASKNNFISAIEPTSKIFQTQSSNQNLKELDNSNLIKPETENCEREIINLENYFKRLELPGHPIKLNSYSTIINLSLFLQSHFAAIKMKSKKNIINNKSNEYKKEACFNPSKLFLRTYFDFRFIMFFLVFIFTFPV